MKFNWSTIIIIALLILAALLLWDTKCNNGKIFSGKQSHGDTLRITRDTTIYRDTGSIEYLPSLVKETPFPIGDGNTNTGNVDGVIDTPSPGFLPAPPQIDSSLLKDYLTTREYNDTTRIDSVGWVGVNSLVFGNKLIRQKVSHSIKSTSTSTTITVKEKLRNTLYISGNVTGGFVYSGGLGLGFMDKKQRVFKANYNSTIAGQQFVQVEAMLPLFRKR